MSYFNNDAIQVAEYEYDFAVDGGATGVYTLSSKANKAALPVGAIKVGHQVLVNTAFVGSGASAILGVSGDTDRYMVITAAGNVGAGLETSSASAVFISAANLSDCLLTVSGAALTAGKLKVLISFVNPNA
jgi:hypothetical protein